MNGVWLDMCSGLYIGRGTFQHLYTFIKTVTYPEETSSLRVIQMWRDVSVLKSTGLLSGQGSISSTHVVAVSTVLGGADAFVWTP